MPLAFCLLLIHSEKYPAAFAEQHQRKYCCPDFRKAGVRAIRTYLPDLGGQILLALFW